MENDEKYYEIVAKEIRENRINDAIWTKAIAESGGEENKTKAVYIQLRVKQLMRNDIKTQYNEPVEPEPGQAPTETWDDSEEYDSGDSPLVLQMKGWVRWLQYPIFIFGLYAIYEWVWPWARSLR